MKSSATDTVLKVSIVVLVAVLVAVVGEAVRFNVVGEGDSAPDFMVRTDTGKTVSLSNFGGKLLILNFWATWCPPCVDELPSLQDVQQRFQDRGLVVLGISVDEDEQTYQKFLKDHGVKFLTARDPGGEIPASYGTFRYPETYIIDSQGKVLQKIVGPAQWTADGMTSYIQSLL